MSSRSVFSYTSEEEEEEEEEEEMPPAPKKPAAKSPAAPSPKRSAATAVSYASEEEEEEMRPPPKKPAANSPAAPSPKPSTATAAQTQARKSKPLAKPSPPDSRSGEGKEGEDEDVDEEESQSDTDENTMKTQQPQPPLPKPPATDDSGSGSDSSDSESSDQAAPQPAINPPSSKAMDVGKKRKDKAPEVDVEVEVVEGLSVKRPFQRIWSDEDEMALLRGLVDYHAKNGTFPSSITDMGPFHDFVHKSLTVPASQTQLFNKVRTLKKKHENASTRRIMGASFKPREEAAWELSSQIWGNGGKNVNRVRNNREKRSKNGEEDEGDDGLAVECNGHLLLKTGSRKSRAALAAEESLHMLDHLTTTMLEKRNEKVTMAELKMDECHLELLMQSHKLFRKALARQ